MALRPSKVSLNVPITLPFAQIMNENHCVLYCMINWLMR